MRYFLVLSFCFLLACSPKAKAPKLNEKEFENLLFELHVADALLEQKGLTDRKLKERNASYYNYVFLKYNITRGEFEEMVHYYSDNTKTYKAMYSRVLDRLTDKKNTYQQADSLKKEDVIVNEAQHKVK